MYIYLLALLFRLFGPSILVARLLSAGLTVIAVSLLWLLAYRLSRRKIVATTSAISALLTPWLFENSRLVFEVALYPVLMALFLFTVRHASKQEQWRLREALAIAATLALLTYSYSIGRLLAPLFALGLVFFVTRKRLRSLLTTWALYFLSVIPALVFHYQHPNALMNRFWLLTYITPEKPIWELALTFLQHYLANINPWAIAVTGEFNVGGHVGSMGSVLAPTLLLAIPGIVYVIRRFTADSWWRYVLYALVVTPISASLTVTEFPQIRLVALPVLLHVFMVPALSVAGPGAIKRRSRGCLLFCCW